MVMTLLIIISIISLLLLFMIGNAVKNSISMDKPLKNRFCFNISKHTAISLGCILISLSSISFTFGISKSALLYFMPTLVHIPLFLLGNIFYSASKVIDNSNTLKWINASVYITYLLSNILYILPFNTMLW